MTKVLQLACWPVLVACMRAHPRPQHRFSVAPPACRAAPAQFCGEALNVRQGRKRATYTGKELKKDMERFLETGLVRCLLGAC
jgi:hypothetical protein